MAVDDDFMSLEDWRLFWDHIKDQGEGYTPLHEAALHPGKLAVEAAAAFLESGGDVNARHLKLGVTPLHLAAFSGNIPVARVLLGRGADVNARDKDDYTPLHRACFYDDNPDCPKSPEMVELLLNLGADPAAVDSKGFTAADIARITKNGAAAAVLAERD